MPLEYRSLCLLLCELYAYSVWSCVSEARSENVHFHVALATGDQSSKILQNTDLQNSTRVKVLPNGSIESPLAMPDKLAWLPGLFTVLVLTPNPFQKLFPF